MNEKEILKRAINQTEENLVKEFATTTIVTILGVTFLMICGPTMILHGGVVTALGVLAEIAIAGLIIHKCHRSIKKIRNEADSLWNKTYIAVDRVEMSIDEILEAVRKEQTRSDIIDFVNKKKRERIYDELALLRLQEKEINHIPTIE